MTLHSSTANRQLTSVLFLVVGALLCTFLVAPGLWLDHPFFGTMPLADGLPRLVPPADYVLLASLVLLLIPILLAGERRRRRWILLWCGLCAARCIWDRITWQPYIYQYFFMLLTIAWASPAGPRSTEPRKQFRSKAKEAEQKRALVALNILRLIVLSVYFWSGVSKVNAGFLETAMPQLLEHLLPAGVFDIIRHFVVAIPIIEILIAVGLLVGRFRTFSVLGALAMHVSILLMIGPWELDYNRVVWPWNVAMMIWVALLFWKQRMVSSADILGWRAPLFQWCILFFCTVCPGLAFIGLWHPHLSFRLYSGSESLAVVLLSQEGIDQLPEATRAEVTLDPREEYAGYLALPHWSDKELGALVPSDPRIYRRVGRRLCDVVTPPNEMVLEMRSPPHWWTGEIITERLACRDLRAHPIPEP